MLRPGPLRWYIISKFESATTLEQYRGVWASAAAWTALIKDHFSKRADASFTEADFNNALHSKYKDSFNSGDETNTIGIK